MTATYQTFSAGSPPATDTIREMLHAFNAAGGSLSGAYSPDQIRGMERAAKVLLDRALGPVLMCTFEGEQLDRQKGIYRAANWLLSHRRAMIEQPKASTLQDRVFAILNDYGIVRTEVAEAIAKEVENA